MNLYIEDNSEIEMKVNQSDEIDLRAGDTINLGSSDYNDLTNKPSIEGVELVGDVSLDDLGVAYAEDIPTDVSELTNDAGYITSEDIPPIPEKTSDLTNDSGFITHDEIFTDLGEIDSSLYDDDPYIFMNTLTEGGWYKFLWGNGDDFSYFVQVQAMDNGGAIYVNQHYWGNEEDAIAEYIRGLLIEDGEVVDEMTDNYITFEAANNTFASKSHTHYRTDNKALSVWDYCDGSQIRMQNGSPILYTDTLNHRQYVIETWQSVRQPVYSLQKITDLIDSNVFYQRRGYYQGGRTDWGDWYMFGGTVFTP